MARTRGRDLASHSVDDQIRERDEFAGGDLADDDVVGGLEEICRLRMLAGQRAEDELRHRHVGRGFDPVTGDVAERNREPTVGELHEVVDVSADLDTRRGLIGIAELETPQFRY